MIKWGVVGLGSMANNFADAIKEVKNAKLISISSKSSNKLNEFGKKFNIPKENQFSDYDEIIKSKDLDALYICTLNNTHMDLIIKCAKNKKNILCEKPLAINYEEALKISENINKFKVNFYEAIAYRSHPQTLELIKLIKNNNIGELKSIECYFGFKVKRIKPKSRLFNKDFGGGVLLDLGCYPVSFIGLLCSYDDLRITDINGSFSTTNVDDHVEVEFEAKRNIKTKFIISFKENLDNTCLVYGEKGYIKITSPWLPGKKTYIEVVNSNSYFKQFINSEHGVYANQIENVSLNFKNKNNSSIHNLVDIEESLKIKKTLDECFSKLNN